MEPFRRDRILSAFSPARLPPIPTGIPTLDTALDGGISRGEMTLICGPSGSGKTTLMLRIVAQVQRSGELCAWIDADNSLEDAWPRQCGVDPERLYIVTPDCAETALSAAASLTRSGAFMLVVIDSATGLVPRVEIESRGYTLPPGGEHHLISLFLASLRLPLASTQTALLITDKESDPRISTVYHDLETNLERTALKARAATRLELAQQGPIRQDGHTIGCRIGIKVLRNLFHSVRHATEFDIMYCVGNPDHSRRA